MPATYLSWHRWKRRGLKWDSLQFGCSRGHYFTTKPQLPLLCMKSYNNCLLGQFRRWKKITGVPYVIVLRPAKQQIGNNLLPSPFCDSLISGILIPFNPMDIQSRYRNNDVIFHFKLSPSFGPMALRGHFCWDYIRRLFIRGDKCISFQIQSSIHKKH